MRVQPDSGMNLLLRKETVVVGGGIAGLYCCYQLSRLGRPVMLAEASNRLGGRIETWRIDEDKLYAEFGPMRIEPDRQRLLGNLLDDLGFQKCDSVRQAKDGELVPFKGYRSTIPTKPVFDLRGEEANQKTLLDLLMLTIRRILARLPPLKWNSSAQAPLQHMFDRSRRKNLAWKNELAHFLDLLDDADFDTLRNEARLGDVFLWDMGFWDGVPRIVEGL